MTNREILLGECVLHNITEEVHTYARWKTMGYTVRKGEHALFATVLYTPCYDKKTDTTKVRPRKSYLFGRSQVETTKIKEV